MVNPFHCAVWAAAALCAGVATAASSAMSASSEAGSSASDTTSSASNSLADSSNASSAPARTNAGAHRIVEMAEVAARPNLVRLTLQPIAPDAPPLRLTLPRQTLKRAELGQGALIDVRPRDYGIEFAKLDGDAFFLVLDDRWHHELRAKAVGL